MMELMLVDAVARDEFSEAASWLSVVAAQIDSSSIVVGHIQSTTPVVRRGAHRTPPEK
jgi:hypothetical protein